MASYGIREVSLGAMKAFAREHHYCGDVFPPHCLVRVGAFRQGQLVGISSWGWGVRPKHTIRKLFPSLSTGDYFELNRLCLHPDEPRNSESHFLRLSTEFIRQRYRVKLLFTWADGIRGKPGYVYQAANWLYGGFIVTEVYVTAAGAVVHPRQLITRHGRRDMAFTESLGLRKVRGKQFRYCLFLCGHKERKRLLRESTVRWTRNYPKRDDLVWWHVDAAQGSRETREPPRFESAVRSGGAAPLFDDQTQVRTPASSAGVEKEGGV